MIRTSAGRFQLALLGGFLFALSIPRMLAAQQKLIPESSTWKYFKGTEEPPSDWNALDFDDSAWLEGQTPIGYSSDLTYKTLLSDMQNNYLSAYIRRKFTVEDPSTIALLKLRMKYDDGFIAYLNGTEILRKGFAEGAAAPYNATASDHETNATFEDTILNCGATQLLRKGDNVLAIKGHNVNLTSSDFSLEVELEAFADPCPTQITARLLSDKKRVQVSWTRPAGITTYDELTLTRNGAELALTSTSQTSYIDREPSPGPNEYVLRARLCSVECVLQTTFVFEGEGPKFRRGDANADGAINLTDALYVLNHLFRGAEEPGCMDAADSNDDGTVNLSDPIYLLRHLFQGGPELPAPGFECGPDPETGADTLPACVYVGC